MRNNKMTVYDALDALNVTSWTRISIRRHGECGVEYLGGGHTDRVIKRFGEKEIVDTSVIDNILVIHVR